MSIASKTFVKLSDFGLARHVIENESLDLTRSGAIMGTPKYMSPEQCRGEKVDGRSDIYSIGATLFYLVTGKPPFEADTAFAIINQHLNTPAPSPKKYEPQLSDGLCSIIEKTLRKDPEERYQDVNELLNDVESLIRGEPTALVVHPQLPCDKSPGLLRFEFSWSLKSSPKELWPYVTNTERINKTLGLVAPNYSYVNDKKKGRVLFAKNNSKVFALEWEEHPYEWLYEKRMSVLREYNYGIFQWMASIVEFQEQEQGTLLTHRFVVSPRGRLARILLRYQFSKSLSKKLDLVYRRIDAFCQHSHEDASDAFGEEKQHAF